MFLLLLEQKLLFHYHNNNRNDSEVYYVLWNECWKHSFGCSRSEESKKDIKENRFQQRNKKRNEKFAFRETAFLDAKKFYEQSFFPFLEDCKNMFFWVSDFIYWISFQDTKTPHFLNIKIFIFFCAHLSARLDSLGQVLRFWLLDFSNKFSRCIYCYCVLLYFALEKQKLT